MNADAVSVNLRSSAAKIFFPAAIDELGDIVSHNEFVGKTGFRTSIDDDWRFVNEMVALNRRPCGIDI